MNSRPYIVESEYTHDNPESNNASDLPGHFQVPGRKKIMGHEILRLAWRSTNCRSLSGLLQLCPRSLFDSCQRHNIYICIEHSYISWWFTARAIIIQGRRPPLCLEPCLLGPVTVSDYPPVQLTPRGQSETSFKLPPLVWHYPHNFTG